MLELEADTTTFANTRFVISPVCTAVESLCLLRRSASPAGGIRLQVRQVVRDRKLALLEALFGGAWDYVPDFITPHPTTPHRDLSQELHAIATTTTGRLRWELGLLVGGVPGAFRAHPASEVLRDAIEQGEQSLAERLAVEIEQYWHALVAPLWSSLRARMQNDIELRAKSVVQHGLAETLAGLHPRLRPWQGTQLHLLSHLSGRIPSSGGLVLVPMAFALPNLLLIADLIPAPEQRSPMIGYPALPRVGADDFGSAAPELLGATRARILADLQTPRSTAELSQRHYLTAGTVSYHLGILHRAGLVSRARSGYRVFYQQTERLRQALCSASQGL